MKLTNTLSGKKEEFIAINESTKKVGMYSCGFTVYNYSHIGNLRKYIFDDILRRTLELNGYEVNQVMNVTDVGHLVSDGDEGEDKIEKGAQREGKTAQEITQHFAKAFFDDLQTVNIKAALDKDIEAKTPWATHHIPEQIELIKILENKGYTYTTSDGVYYDTSKFKNYGKLGNINIEGLKEGARVEGNAEKRNATDFALWKFSPKQGSGQAERQQEWQSPWGIGFPGWHIECSAMSMKYLGEHFDIHTGGIDHIPVHHNNEIAQSEAATGKKFVNYWVHENFLNIDNTKISKSLGNVIRLPDLIEKSINPLAYRYWILTAHYKNPVNFTWEALQGAEIAYKKLIDQISKLGSKASKPDENYLQKFKDFVSDDLDTAKGIALMWEMLKDSSLDDAAKKATIFAYDEVLGLDVEAMAQKINSQKATIPANIQKLITEREEARENKDYKKSDELREALKKLGFDIKDK